MLSEKCYMSDDEHLNLLLCHAYPFKSAFQHPST